MDPELRPVAGDAEVAAAAQLLSRAFGWSTEHMARFAPTLDHSRTLGAFVGGELAAFSRIRPFGLFVGGRSVPMGGFSPVGSAPEYRGRGLATAVTVGQFPDMLERGEVVSALYPASMALYRRAGFGLAGVWGWHKVPGRALREIARPAVPVQPRRGREADIPAVEAAYAAYAPNHTGHLDRPREWWARIFDAWDTVHLYVVDGEEPGTLAGYVRYRHEHRPDWGYRIEVDELVAATTDVARALWRLVGSSATQSPEVEVNGPPEHPLLHLLAEQDLTPSGSMRFMVRLVDAAGAMAARGWPAGARLAVDLDVADPHCEWNRGRCRLVVEDGKAVLERGGTGAVGVDVHALASLYTGYASPWQLALAGGLRGATESQLADMAEAFAGPAPWMVDFF